MENGRFIDDGFDDFPMKHGDSPAVRGVSIPTSRMHMDPRASDCVIGERRPGDDPGQHMTARHGTAGPWTTWTNPKIILPSCNLT